MLSGLWKLAEMYGYSGERELEQKQIRAAEVAGSIHTIAILKFQDLEVNFRFTPEGTLSAHVYKTLTHVFTFKSFSFEVRRQELFSTREENIYHAGWFYNTSLREMSAKQKEEFISSLNQRKIYKIEDKKIYLT